MVLGGGRLREFDSPANLLRQPGSDFGHMVEEMGPQAAAHLRELALEKDKEKQGGKGSANH